jgi:hypothetical protein
MSEMDPSLLNRRRVLYAAMLGGGGAALSACVPPESSSETDIWAGFDKRITERSTSAQKRVSLCHSAEDQ